MKVALAVLALLVAAAGATLATLELTLKSSSPSAATSTSNTTTFPPGLAGPSVPRPLEGSAATAAEARACAQVEGLSDVISNAVDGAGVATLQALGPDGTTSAIVNAELVGPAKYKVLSDDEKAFMAGLAKTESTGNYTWVETATTTFADNCGSLGLSTGPA